MRRRSAVLFALAINAPGLAAQHASHGWTYTMNIAVDSGDALHSGSMAMRYRTTADHLRTEIVQVSGAMVPRKTPGLDIEGFYNILNEKDSTYYTVMPQQHAALLMMNPVLSIPKSSGPIVRVEDGLVRKLEDLGPGERMLGHATRHYRSTVSGTMTTNIGGETCSYPMDGVTEMWVAPDLTIVPAMRSMVAHYGVDLPDSTVANSQMKGPPGLALKTVARSNVTLASGERRVVTSTMQFTEISQAPIDDAVFQVPSDYHVMDVRSMVASVSPQMLDSLRAARPARAGCHR